MFEDVTHHTAPRSGTLMLHLTGRCNLRCDHCYMEGSPERGEALPLGWVLDAVGSTERTDIGQLYLTGGEPLLYPDLRSILFAASQVEGLQTTLCTNGTLLDEATLLLLQDNIQTVQLSVDGPSAFHDVFRGQVGSFRRTERAIRRLAEAQIPVTVVSTLNRHNVDFLGELIA